MKLHSIAAVINERNFEGRFEAAGIPYTFSFSPSRATITGKVDPDRRSAPRASQSPSSKGAINPKLRLTGSLTLLDARPNARVAPRSLRSVQATLMAIQGGIGSAPPRAKLPVDVSPAREGLPVVESTGALSFCGVLYFELSSLETLRLRADLTGVQLNVRLAPRNERERRFQGVYSTIADAIYGKVADVRAAEAALAELNKLLA